MITYEYDDETFVADKCLECIFSYVDDLFNEWCCRRKKCRYTEKQRRLIAEKERVEMERAEMREVQNDE